MGEVPTNSLKDRPADSHTSFCSTASATGTLSGTSLDAASRRPIKHDVGGFSGKRFWWFGGVFFFDVYVAFCWTDFFDSLDVPPNNA